MRYWIGLLLFLCACVRLPEYETAAPLKSAGCETPLKEAQDQGSFTFGDWPQKNWWEDFKDESLNSIIDQALKLSPTLKKSEEALRAASQFAQQKKASLYPEVDFDADNNWQHLAKDGFFRHYAPTIPSVVNDIHLGLSYKYEFDFWGKNRDLFHAALGKASALAAEKQQAELILTTSISYTYMQTQLLLHLRSLTELIEINRTEIQKTREKRQLHALDASIIRLQSQNEKLETSASLIELDQQIELLFHKIKNLSGLSQDAKLEILKQPMQSTTLTLPENLSLDLLARRPDLVAQKMRMEAAAREIGAARTDFYPNINLMGVLGFETVIWSLFQKKNINANVDPAIHLPIFTAGRIKAQLMEKVSEFNRAVHSYNELILEAAQEVADALSKIILLQKEIEVRKSSAKVAEAQSKISEKRFLNALDDRIEVLLSKNNLLEMQKKLLEFEYAKVLAEIQLIRSLGGGFHE